MKSKLGKAIKAVASHREASPAHRQFLERLVRVDQAGELAADLIYKGQHMVFSRTQPQLAPLIRHMWDQEVLHHNTFDQLQTEGRVRPSLLTPVWKVAAFALGAATALRGKEAAMACTEAVETVIGGHYNQQLRKLHSEFPSDDESPEFAELKQLIVKFRDDELEHLNTAVENDAHGARPYWLLTETIKTGCKGAIFLAERF